MNYLKVVYLPWNPSDFTSHSISCLFSQVSCDLLTQCSAGQNLYPGCFFLVSLPLSPTETVKAIMKKMWWESHPIFEFQLEGMGFNLYLSGYHCFLTWLFYKKPGTYNWIWDHFVSTDNCHILKLADSSKLDLMSMWLWERSNYLESSLENGTTTPW